MDTSNFGGASQIRRRVTEFTLICIGIILAPFAEAAYVYVILCCFPLLYSISIERIVNIDPSTNAALQNLKWETALGDVISLSYPASGVGFVCIGIGAYVAQRSYESRPATLGLILMVLGLDALVNAFTISLYIRLVAKYARADRLKTNKESYVRRTAKLFAVPASSMIWCFLMAFLAVICYSGQSLAIPIDPKPYLDGRDIANNPGHCTGTSLPPSSTQPLCSLPNSTCAPSHVARSCVSVVAAACIVRSLFVLYSILDLRCPDKQPLGSYGVDIELNADSSASP